MHNYITAERLLWRGSAKIPKSGQLRPASRSATVGGVTERQDNLLISFSSAGQPAVRDRDSDSRLSARAGKISHVIADCATTGPTAEVARKAGTRCHPRDAPAVRCSQGPDGSPSSVGETSNGASGQERDCAIRPVDPCLPTRGKVPLGITDTRAHTK